MPFISFDQPWFLRRYVPIVIPVSFLSTAIFSHRHFRNRMYKITLVGLVIMLNLSVSAPIIFHREYGGMLTDVEDICKMFSKDDLILVDRYAAGNYKLADPMFFIFDRYSLWIGPAGDWCSIDKLRVDFSKYRNVYLVTGSHSGYLTSEFPQGSLELVLAKEIQYEELQRTVDLQHWTSAPPDVYDIDYPLVESSIEAPRNISKNSYLILVYKLNFNYLNASDFRIDSGKTKTLGWSLKYTDNYSFMISMCALTCLGAATSHWRKCEPRRDPWNKS